MSDVAGWDEIKESLPIGSVVSCIVTRHAPFGIFVKIASVPFDGLIQITDFKDAGRMTPVEFPAIGSSLKAVVLGFKETGQQIWLGIKPSQIDNAEKKGASTSADVPVPREFLEAAAALRFPPSIDERLQALMDRNTDGIMTPPERDELEALIQFSQTLSLLRAKALHRLGRRPQ